MEFLLKDKLPRPTMAVIVEFMARADHLSWPALSVVWVLVLGFPIFTDRYSLLWDIMFPGCKLSAWTLAESYKTIYVPVMYVLIDNH